ALPWRQVLQQSEHHAVVEIDRHVELPARGLFGTANAVADLRLIVPAFSVEGDLRAGEGGTPLRKPILLQTEDAVLQVGGHLIVDRSIGEAEDEVILDFLAARSLDELPVPEVPARRGPYGEKAPYRALGKTDGNWGCAHCGRTEDHKAREPSESTHPNSRSPCRNASSR